MYNGKLSDLCSHIGDQPIDLFLCSASFEERCRSITDHLDSSYIRRSWIAFNENFGEVVAENVTHLHTRLGDASTEIVLNTNDPILSADNISQSLERAFKEVPQRVVIDITSFTRESLLILVKFLCQNLKSTDTLEFLYAYAGDYSVGDPPEEKWLSKGIREVRSILGYPGDMLPSRRNHLIVLVGFEDERALNLIRECEPSKISLGVGDEAERGTAPHQETNIHRLGQLKSVFGMAETFTFKGYDAEATKTKIREQIAKAPELNTIIAPMNTKISTLGAAALALEDEKIQLCYAQANIYNYARYSVPGDTFYHFSLRGFPK